MDKITDSENRDRVSKFLEGHPVRIRPFGRNLSGERAYRRAERLVAALHLLTNHIMPEESAKVRIRRVSLGLLSSVLSLRDELRSPSSGSFQRTLARIRELISLIHILSISGSISTQNADVMSEALDEFGNFLLSAQRSGLSESVALTKEGLAGNDSMHPVSDIKDRKVIKDTSRTKKRNAIASNSSLGGRAGAVIGILRAKGELTVKDITEQFPEYSEKTVQRELARLVSAGHVKKTGSKRWSKYHLV